MIRLASLSATLVLLLLSGCSLPKIIILHDPLSADEHIRLGNIYASQGKDDLAREQYRAATEQDAKHVKAWTLLGELSFRLGDLKQSEKAYVKALDLDPKNGDILNNLAWVYARQDGRFRKAKELVTQAIALHPDHRPYYIDTLGVILLKQGRTAEAISALEESVATIPREQAEVLAEAYLHLSDAYRASSDQERAEKALAEYRRLKQPEKN